MRRTLSFDVAVIGAGPAGLAAAMKCRDLGHTVVVVERQRFGRPKPCGGLTPRVTLETLSYELGLRPPPTVYSEPARLGLYYVSPSGAGGAVPGYELVNLSRPDFDAWLAVEAMKRGAELVFGAADIRAVRAEGWYELIVRCEGRRALRLRARYVVGADGAHSSVRRLCYPGWRPRALRVVQELWRGEGDLGEFFYMALLSPDVTPVYGYVVPKGGGAYLVGVGVYPWQEAEALAYLGRFKDWLSGNLRFKAKRLLRRESGAIPLDEPAPGSGDVVLVGDAAGLTNSFSGEGIRQAVESGLAAAESIDEALRGLGRLSSLYVDKIGYHLEAARRSRTIIPADAKSREEFVEAELRRGLRALLSPSPA